jgi:hypothetical protein
VALCPSGDGSVFSSRKFLKKKLAKHAGYAVQSMAEALKPEHGLEKLAI